MLAHLPTVAPLRDDPTVTAALASLPALDDPMWPVAASGVVEAVSTALANPAALVAAANSVAAIARTEGCGAITGASPLGDRLAGAVASMHSVALFDASVPEARVLVVDGVLVTGAALSILVDRLHGYGVGDIRAAVVVDLGATGGMAGETPVTVSGA